MSGRPASNQTSLGLLVAPYGVLGSRGRGTRFSQQRLTALKRKPLLCGWTGQVASTAARDDQISGDRRLPGTIGYWLAILHPMISRCNPHRCQRVFRKRSPTGAGAQRGRSMREQCSDPVIHAWRRQGRQPPDPPICADEVDHAPPTRTGAGRRVLYAQQRPIDPGARTGRPQDSQE